MLLALPTGMGRAPESAGSSEGNRDEALDAGRTGDAMRVASESAELSSLAGFFPPLKLLFDAHGGVKAPLSAANWAFQSMGGWPMRAISASAPRALLAVAASFIR